MLTNATVDTSVGPLPAVEADLSQADRWGSAKARWGIGRMDYQVEPGLYALGRPDRDAPVLVSANYKMSFDHLRSALPGRDAWILVLDTKGINVWCAAGKGTFGTEELLGRVEATRLAEVVDHRTLIVPQLGAPGVAAHVVRKRSGFRVVYGPVRAGDLPAFLDGGLKAPESMRRKTFPLSERFVLIPVELVAALKYGALLGLAFFFLAGLFWEGAYWPNTVAHGWLAVSALAGAIFAGAVLNPLLLPWIPGRAFSVKGAAIGLAVAGVHLAAWWPGGWLAGWLEVGAWILMGVSVSSFLAMNFTGASTYTSLSGVKKEMRVAVPLQIAAGILGLALWIVARFF